MRISTFNEIKRYNGIGISCKRHIDNSFTAEPIQQVVSFFKYGYIDKIIFNYLRAKHSSKSSLKIISLGCSLGEEAYSYALVLDDLNPKPSINAFDISSALVTLAEQGKFTLSEIERPLLAPTLKDLYSESEPADDIVRIRKAFKENFEAIDEFNNKYQKKKNGFKNCTFEQRNAINLDKIYANDSCDLILCRYILHHLSIADIESIFSQAHSVLKPGGLFSIEPSKSEKYENILINVGFRPAFSLNKGIFQKI